MFSRQNAARERTPQARRFARDREGALALALCFWLALVGSARAEPITGAFGHPFGAAIASPQILGAADAVLPDDVDADIPDDAPEALHTRWVAVQPTAVPRLLDTTTFDLRALVTSTDAPLRLVAAIDAPCDPLVPALGQILAAKYTEAKPAKSSRAATSSTQRTFGDARARVVLRCDANASRVTLDYVDVAGIASFQQRAKDGLQKWREAQRVAEEAATQRAKEAERQAALAKAAEDRVRRRRLVDALIAGTDVHVDGAFGISLREPFAGVPGFVPDVPVPTEAVHADPPFDAIGVQVVLDPDSNPISIVGTATFETPQLALAALDDVVQGLRDKYGNPMKDRPQHRIFDVSGDYVVVKHTEIRTIEISVVQQARLQAKRQRERDAQARIDDERRRQWAVETRGL